ncbi:hypothetical protein [Agromyces bauzanensis]
MHLATAIITIEPWNPWPLLFPGIAEGYGSPTFSGSTDVVGGELPPLAWQAIRDGERVRGVLVPLGGEQWEIRETGG